MKANSNTALVSRHIKDVYPSDLLTNHLDVFCEVFGDISIAHYVSKLVYWSDKGDRSDGYFWKSMPALAAESRISERTAYRYRDRLKEFGVVDTFVASVNGSPTNHWHVDIQRLLDLITEQAKKISRRVKGALRTITNTFKPTPTPLSSSSNDFELVPEKGAFQKFWDIYPKKFSKGQARRAWNRLSPSVELVDTILEDVAAKRQSPQWIKESGRYIPNPTRYIREERWNDTVTPLSYSNNPQGRRISYERNYSSEQISQLFAPIRPLED